MGLAYSENTIKTYGQQVQQYLAFCSKLALPHACDASAANWLLHASEILHLKKSTVMAKLSAYRWAHAALWDLGPANVSVGSVLYLTQRAVARRADDKVPKLAVGEDGLVTLLHSLGSGDGAGTASRWELSAWWTLSYIAFLRCSEVAALSWEDIEFVRNSDGSKVLLVRLAVMGRQIFKNHSETVTFHIKQRLGLACAVKSMAAWCRRCGRPRSGRVFVASVDEVRREFQRRASKSLGGIPGQYGLHSLRAGAATDAERGGMAVSEIKFRGRWRSATVLQYMRAGERLAAELGVPQAGGRALRVM